MLKRNFTTFAILLVALGFHTATAAAPSLDERLDMAREALLRYDVEEAQSQIDAYKKQLAKKPRKNRPEDLSAPVEEQISRISSMLDRVENIAIIDSVVVDKDSFLSAYHLSTGSGSLGLPSDLPYGIVAPDSTTIYTPADDAFVIWTAETPDSVAAPLMISHYLNDGTLESPATLPGSDLSLGATAAFPFLMNDGVTLYFASNGDESLGGYDIYISRDNGDGFLLPQNVGFPYNSPFDDYLLVIDEKKGVGWWATDRNQIPGKLTVYTFIPSSVRRNVDIDNPLLADLARISSIGITQDPGTDYTSLRQLAATDSSSGVYKENENLDIPLPDGSTAASLNLLANDRARDAALRYLSIRDEIESTTEDLNSLRRAYAEGNTSVGNAILQAENQLKTLRANLLRASNDIARAQGVIN